MAVRKTLVWIHYQKEEIVDDAESPGRTTLTTVERKDPFRRFYLLGKHWDEGQLVPTVWENDLDGAAEGFLLPRLRATSPYPPWEKGPDGEGHAPDTLVPPLKLAIDKAGHRFAIGEADWPENDEIRAGELWGYFGREEVGSFEKIWYRLENL